MRGKTVVYWTVTALITLELVVGGATDLAHGREVLIAGQSVIEVLAHLGLPAYLLSILGVWKLLGAVVLLAPGLPRLKEWAYAGTFFELTGAALSGLAVGESLDNVAAPCVFALITLVSWALRPRSRMLGTLSVPLLSYQDLAHKSFEVSPARLADEPRNPEMPVEVRPGDTSEQPWA